MSIDIRVAEFIANHRTPGLTNLFWAITWIGDVATLFCATFVLLAVLVWRGRFRDSAYVLVGMAGASVLTLGLKHLVQRARPGAEYLAPGAPPDTSYSFPSGHTLNTTVFVILLVAVVWSSLPRRRWRIGAAVIAAGTACSVGLSRLYLGYHWTTDVVAGLVLGAVWALALTAYWRTGRPWGADRRSTTPGSGPVDAGRSLTPFG